MEEEKPWGNVRVKQERNDQILSRGGRGIRGTRKVCAASLEDPSGA